MENKIEHIRCQCNQNKCPAYNRCCFLPTEYIKSKKNKVEILFVGQGGGKEERLLVRPFVGVAGVRLRRIIISVYKKLNKSFGVGFSNVIRDNPEDNRVPAEEELKYCMQFLYRDIGILRNIGLKGIVLLGSAARNAFYKDGKNISSVRGIIEELDLKDIGIYKVMSTYHPSYLVRNNLIFRENNIGKLDRIVMDDIINLYEVIS